MKSESQKESINAIRRVIKIFKVSEGNIRPHFTLTGASGSGKSWAIQALADELEIGYMEINAAQLTKEGTSGNSLSKALAPIQQHQNNPFIVFIDEFDKLFISGNSNSSLAHETTNGVQNEFLKVLESDEASVFGDYGKYHQVSVKNALFIFAGAFNGEEDIDIDRLRDFGVKTEFIGRVGLIYNLQKLTQNDLILILEDSKLLKNYINLFDGVSRKDCVNTISEFIKSNYEQNTLGARLVNSLIHQYFINDGKLEKEEVKAISFQKKLSF